jgi:hypothetical protein
MARQNKITISFSREYWDAYDFLKNKGNASRYIWELVRESKQHGSLEARIEKVVSKMLCQNSETNKDDLKKAVDNFDF